MQGAPNCSVRFPVLRLKNWRWKCRRDRDSEGWRDGDRDGEGDEGRQRHL